MGRYSVALASNEGIFDEAYGFGTIEEAKEWAEGRSGNYHVMIDDDNAPEGIDPSVADYWRREGRYSVLLANKDCVFDHASGFATIEEAEKWASGRGRHYHVMIEDNGAPEGADPLVADYWRR